VVPTRSDSQNLIEKKVLTMKRVLTLANLAAFVLLLAPAFVIANDANNSSTSVQGSDALALKKKSTTPKNQTNNPKESKTQKSAAVAPPRNASANKIRMKGDPDEFRKKTAETTIGDRAEGPQQPDSAAIEAFLNRAYPADDIPLTLTVNAQAAFNNLKGRAVGKGKNTPGQWTLIGPSTASFPAVLTFSGASYTTSGRVTALAIDPDCSQSKCRVWSGAAGGGVWRTDNALSGNGTHWDFVSDSFATNAIGALTFGNGVLYAGTGEPNASADSEAGMGIYRSTDGGDTWTHLSSQIGPITTGGNGTTPYTGDAFAGRSIASIIVDPTNPNHLYVASARGVRGVSSVLSGGATTSPPTPRPPFGLFESTDGGVTFSFIWDGSATKPYNNTSPTASVRGIPDVAFDPNYDGNTNKTIYASAFASGAAGSGGVWRSVDGGQNWTQIKSALSAALNTDRPSFAVTKLPNGKTRMYVGVGNSSGAARFLRSDDVVAATPVFVDMTTSQNSGYCATQCWYDNVVYSPAGKPDVVYLGGSYSYGSYGFSTNGRAFLRSSDAGATFTDMTWDATSGSAPAGSCCQPNPISPNGMHPDSHAIVEIPGTDAAIFGSDGGLVRSNGSFTDISAQCANRGLGGASLALCQQLLSAVPNRLFDLNKSLSTLQFQSLSVASGDPRLVQGGTQDNGTFQTTGSAVVWPQIIYGDGGQSGFNTVNNSLRFNTFTGQANDANFQNGDPTKWVIISAPIAASPEGSQFYPPIIADPNSAWAGSIFEGSQSVWRTQDWGGNQAYLEANCPEFFVSSTTPGCGDFVQIGPSGATDLTASSTDYRGATRAGGNVARISRTATDGGTMWVATTTGRVFLSKNANDPAALVTYTRLDNKPSAGSAPGRFVSGIYVDPSNSNHAWISYSGYNFNTPAQPGHVFEIVYNPTTLEATWTRIDNGAGPLGDLPATDVARDDVTGDLYASSDFGVMRLPSGSDAWVLAGTGLPGVEITGLTIVPSARKLFAATHGRSAWALTLP
jgi:hypothetical protein